MTRGVQCLEPNTVDIYPVPFGYLLGYAVGVGKFTHGGDAVGLITQIAKSREVIRMRVGINRPDKPEVKLIDYIEVGLRILLDRINDKRFPAAARCNGGGTWTVP